MMLKVESTSEHHLNTTMRTLVLEMPDLDFAKWKKRI